MVRSTQGMVRINAGWTLGLIAFLCASNSARANDSCCEFDIKLSGKTKLSCCSRELKAWSCGAQWTMVGQTAGVEIDPSGDMCTLRVTDCESLVTGEIKLRAQRTADKCEDCESPAPCDAEVTIIVEGNHKPPYPPGPPCPTCRGGFGDGEAENSSVDVRLSLGTDSDEESVGMLLYKVSQPVNAMPSVQELEVIATMSSARKLVPMPIGQYKLQIKVPAGLAQVVDNDTSLPGFQVEFYTEPGTPDENGIYSPTGLYRTWTFSRQGDILCQLTDGEGKYFQYTYASAAPSGWTLAQLIGTSTPAKVWSVSRLSATTQPASRTETYQILDGSDTLIYREESDFQEVGNSEVRVATREYDVVGGSAVRTDTRGYYENGKIKYIENADGSWQWYDYDGNGRLWHKTQPWRDVTQQAVDTAEHPYALARTLTYDYASLDTSCNPLVNVHCDGGGDSRPRTITETIAGVPVARTFYEFKEVVVGEAVYPTTRVIRDLHPESVDTAARYADASNPTTVTTYNSDCALSDCPAGSGRIISVWSEDNQLTLSSYIAGTYVTTSVGVPGTFTPGQGQAIREEVTHTTYDQPDGIDGQTTREVIVHDERGRMRLQQTYLRWQNTYVGPIDQTVYDYDVYGHLAQTTKLDGTYAEQYWTCCHKEWETDYAGVQTLFDYDNLGRVWHTTKQADANITTEHLYDALGRATGSVTTAVDSVQGTLERATGWVVDGFDRVLTQTDEAGLVTQYAYSTTTAGGKVVAIARPGDTLQDPTEVQEYFLDGRLKRVHGKGVIETNYDYGVNVDGTQYTTVYTGPDGTSSPRWVKTTTDVLGRTYKEEKPSFNDGTNPGNLVTEYEYYTDNQAGHGKGRLKAIKPPQSLAQTIYEYDAFGNVTVTATDVNNDGLTLASNDRVQRTETNYQLISGDWHRVTTRSTYPDTGSATPVLVSSDDTQLTGLSPTAFNYRVHTDYYNDGTASYPQVTTQWSELDRVGKRVMYWTTYPDSNAYGLELYINGLLITSVNKIEWGVSYGYDALERKTRTSLSNIGDTFTHYVLSPSTGKLKGRIDYTEDADGRVTDYRYYEQTGRLFETVDPLMHDQKIEYTDRGEIRHVWGLSPYPVEYEYNAYGERTKMRTYRNAAGPGPYWSGATWPSNPPDPQETTWTYNAATGLLTAKTDAANQSVTYSYTPDGRMKVRTWARGVTTTYAYWDSGSLRTGELMSVVYSNGWLTPQPAYTYTRTGQVATVIDSNYGLNLTYTYAGTGQLLSEAGGWGDVLARSYGGAGAPGVAVGRPTGLTLTMPDVADYEVGYAYDHLGQLSTITGPGLPAGGVHYTYVQESDSVDRVDFGSSSPASSLAWADYTLEFEAMQNPTNRMLIRSVENGYRSGGNAVTASSYIYSNDDGGRRAAVIRSGEAFPPNTNYDGFKDVNLYDVRNELTLTTCHNWTAPDVDGPSIHSFGYYYDCIGNRRTSSIDAASTTYTINNLLNQYDAVSNPAASFTYDADGNLIGDGVYSYTWDAENRLQSICPIGPLQNDDPGMFFWYDHLGRVWITEYDRWTSGNYEPVRYVMNLYDGWNLLEQIDVSVQTELLAQYTWGLDLSHTLHGAGGIGGLLAMHLPACPGETGGSTSLLDGGLLDPLGFLKAKPASPLAGGGPAVGPRLTAVGQRLPRPLAEPESLGGGEGQVRTPTSGDRAARPGGGRTPADIRAAALSAGGSGVQAAGLDGTMQMSTGAGQAPAGDVQTLTSEGGAMQTLTTSEAGCDYWYLYDANGNVGQLLHYTAGETPTVTLAAAYEYDPYGKTLAARDVDGSGIATFNKFRFSTKWLNDSIAAPGQVGAVGSTGLYYYGYRFYSPTLGRWISRDRIGEIGGINLLGYVQNSPVDDCDPFGLAVPDCSQPNDQLGSYTSGGGIDFYAWLRTEHFVGSWSASITPKWVKKYSACGNGSQIAQQHQVTFEYTTSTKVSGSWNLSTPLNLGLGLEQTQESKATYSQTFDIPACTPWCVSVWQRQNTWSVSYSLKHYSLVLILFEARSDWIELSPLSGSLSVVQDVPEFSVTAKP